MARAHYSTLPSSPLAGSHRLQFASSYVAFSLPLRSFNPGYNVRSNKEVRNVASSSDARVPRGNLSHAASPTSPSSAVAAAGTDGNVSQRLTIKLSKAYAGGT